MPLDAACVDACVAGCFAVCLAIPPPLGEVLLPVCGAACFITCQTENIVLNDGIGGPEFPFEQPPDTEV